MLSKLICFCKKKTEKIRKIFVSFMVKYITPSLFKRIEPFFFNNWVNVPRPAILFIKKYFNQKDVIGAEIGVEKGINSESILKELNISTLYLVDIWFDYNEIGANRPQKANFELVSNKFKNNLKVKIIKDFSLKAVKEIPDNSLDFVYIDANHSYKYVYQDISVWFNKVKEGGIIAGHDAYNHLGVSTEVFKALIVFCTEKNIDFQIKIPDWYFIKTKQINGVEID